MRSFLFSIAYWVLSAFYASLVAILSMLPGRKPMAFALRLYTWRMLWAMHWIAGIKVEVKGKERLPPGAFIIAAKHHSWGDGFVMFAHVENLSFVTNNQLEKIPLLKGILRKFGAIVVDNCGGPEARRALSRSAAQANAEGRRILIYPEGHLAKPGEHFRYRTGVYHMARDFNLPVVPVATNLGCFWQQMDFAKKPGVATVEFLDPIQPGLTKDAFLAQLEAVVEARSQELIAQAKGEPVRPSLLVANPDEVKKAALVAEAA
ncbi:MAG: 1-acyl-sn-glycerol-3-phosphate acyltransferase [Caulobacter sp.]|nr:1-acyl-sn-glycerol-3-phosphate acyltransferase [Caulobacter sp.]